MNHIYKTIFNKRTGQIAVVSEKSQNHGRSQQEKIHSHQIQEQSLTAPKSPSFLKKQLTVAMGVLLGGVLSQISYAETTQNYTGSGALLSSSTLINGFKDLMSDPYGERKGIVVVDNNQPTGSNTQLTIDYSIGNVPDFAVAGYATFDQDKPEAQQIEVDNNKVTLKQGNLNGPVYAGLVQYTQKTDDINCAIDTTLCNSDGTSIKAQNRFQNINITNNTNIITIEEGSQIQVKGDLIAGQSLIQFQYADLNAAPLYDYLLYATTSATATAYINDTVLTSNGNTILIDGTTTQNINAGQSLIQFQYADLNAAPIYASSDASYHATADAEATAYINNTILTSNGNTISIDETNTQNINVGQSLIQFQYADLNAASVDAYIYAISKANASAQINDSILNSNENTISIDGTNTQNINVGQSLIQLQYADFNAANVKVEIPRSKYDLYAISEAYAKTLINDTILASNRNTISINETTTQNINVGQSLIQLQYADLNAAYANGYSIAGIGHFSSTAFTDDGIYNTVLTSNENTISIDGITTTQNINAGQSLIQLQYADFNAGSIFGSVLDTSINDVSVHALTSVQNTALTSNGNTISIDGTITTQNINAGQIGIKHQYGDLKAGKTTIIIGDTKFIRSAPAYHDVQLQNTSMDANSNQIDLKGKSTISGNLTTGYIDFHLGFGKLIKLEIDTDPDSPNYEKATEKEVDNPLIYIDVIRNSTSGKTNYINLNGTKAFANNNTISIEGTHTFVQGDIQDQAFPDDPTKTIKGDYGSIYGGYLNYNKDQDYFLADANGNATEVKAFVRPETYDVFTGNTLNYNNNVPITIKEIGNFQNYNFTLNPTLANQNLITANTVYLGSSLENMSANQLQKTIYNTVSQEALASTSLSDEIKALIPIIADDATNPSYVITDEVKTALLASDISQQTKNLLADNAQINSNIHVVGIQSGPAITAGTKFVLMQADQGNLKGDGQGYLDHVIQVQQGISLLYDVQTVVDHDNDQVYALFKSGINPAENIPTPSIDPEVNPHLKALLEGNLSGLMLLTRGADHLSDNLFGDEQHKRGLVPFAIFSGQHSRYNTGSHIKSNSGLFTAGFSVYDDNYVWGAFMENGWDSYKTYNDFDNAPDVHGKGHNRFNGVGLFGRYTFENQIYLDGTLRGGRLHTAFETDDIRHIVTGERASYNLSGNYYGASLKGGYDWAWNTRNTVDLSAKYSWASTSSHDVNITGDDFHFDGLNSHRVLLNAENSYQFTPELSFISGLGYEYEFDGKAQGTTYGRFEIDDASVKGSTGVVTAGLHYEPSRYKRLSLDLKGSGYFGKREGGSALLKVDYKF